MSNLHSTHKKEEGRRLSSLRKNLLKIGGGMFQAALFSK
jgi:hypothetical protein